MLGKGRHIKFHKRKAKYSYRYDMIVIFDTIDFLVLLDQNKR